MKSRLAAAALALLASAAHADPIDSAIGHALRITDASGAARTYRLGADNSFTTEDTAGVWRAEAARLCLTPEGGAEFCVPYDRERAVGESWTVAGPGGRAAFTFELVE